MRAGAPLVALALAAALDVLMVAVPTPARAMEPVEALVTSQSADTVSVVRLADLKVVGEIAVDGKPAGIALSPDRKLAYVTSPEGKVVTVIDAGARTIVSGRDSDTMPDARTIVRRFAAGSGPLGIAVDPRNGRIYVADWYEHKVRAFDPADLRQIGEAGVGKSPSGVAVTADGALVLTADRDSNQITLLDAATLAIRGTVAVGERPFGVTVSADGRRAYTANVGSNDVSVIELATRSVVGTVKVGRRPYAVALAQGRAFVTDQYSATVTVFDTATLAVLKTIDVGEYPEGIAADPSGRAVYVACWSSNTLERIDAAAMTVTGKVAVADGPRAFGEFLR